MAGKLNLVTCSQTPDGQALATFDYQRENMPSLRFQQVIPGNAQPADVTKLLLTRVSQIVAGEPVPAVGIVNQMFAGGPRAIPDPETGDGKQAS